MHFNLHKTFSTPHGGGGPGAGPGGGRTTRWRRSCRRRWCVRDAGRQLPPRAARRAADVHRPGARLPGQRRRARARLCLHPRARRQPACVEVSEDAVLAANYLRGARRRGLRAALRRALQARVRGHRPAAPGGDRRAHAGRRQAAHRLRLPPADHLLPAHRRGVPAHRAHRDRDARGRSTPSRTRSWRDRAARRASDPELLHERAP